MHSPCWITIKWAQQDKEEKPSSSNSQVLKRPVSEENCDFLGGAFYSPLVAEKGSWISLVGRKKSFGEPVRHVCSPMTAVAAESLDTIHSINYNTQRACHCVPLTTMRTAGERPESTFRLQRWSLSFHHGKLSLNVLVISSPPPIVIINWVDWLWFPQEPIYTLKYSNINNYYFN